jgi:hypothetical protein
VGWIGSEVVYGHIMELEQMIECLLAKTDGRMDASTKAIQEKTDTTQERMDANTKAMQERMEGQIDSLVTIVEAAR